jgi:Xaa-Pro aminopeptidase
MPSTPLKEIQNRIRKLQAAMAEHGLDAALIVQRVDLFYLSGTGQDAHLFVPMEGPPLLMVRRNFERAVEESPLQEIIQVSRLTDIKEPIMSGVPSELRTLGMELDVLPVNNYRLYEEIFPGTRIVDVSPVIRTIRMTKSPYEVGLIREAALVNDTMFAQVAHVLKEGISEMEFAGLLEAIHRRNGHQGTVRVRGFNQEVFYGHIMSGPNLAVPTCSLGPTGGPGPNPTFPQGAGHKIIRKNEPVQVDYVAAVNGYLVDQARTFFLGHAAEKFRRVHATALAIQETIARDGRPGTPVEELYARALQIAQTAGPEWYFMGWPQPVPFVGHGVGMELDEWPVIGRNSGVVLEEGMVMALEPKFILPGEGLAGIENCFVVGPDGLEKLTLFDDEIHVI